MHHIVNDYRQTLYTVPLGQFAHLTNAKLLGKDGLASGFLHVILTRTLHTDQYIGYRHVATLTDGMSQGKGVGGITLMSWGWHKHHPCTDIRCHQVGCLIDGFGVPFILDVTSQSI